MRIDLVKRWLSRILIALTVSAIRIRDNQRFTRSIRIISTWVRGLRLSKLRPDVWITSGRDSVWGAPKQARIWRSRRRYCKWAHLYVFAKRLAIVQKY